MGDFLMKIFLEGDIKGDLYNKCRHPISCNPPCCAEYVTTRYPHHFFHIFDGWGISAKVFRDILKTQIPKVFVTIRLVKLDSEGDKTLAGLLKTDLQTFLKRGKVWYHGDDRQYVLEKKMFQFIEKNIKIAGEPRWVKGRWKS